MGTVIEGKALTERENDIADGQKCLVEISIYRGLDVFAWMLNPDPNQGDKDGRENTGEG